MEKTTLEDGPPELQAASIRPGSGQPCIFDDGDLQDQRPDTFKALLDPTDAATMVKARWGATKLVNGQCRYAAGNEFEASAEK